MSPIWVSTSHFYSTDEIDPNAKSNTSQSLDEAGDDATNKNLSKMRSYLKRCETAINRINLSGKRAAGSLSSSSSSTSTSTERYGPRSRSSTSSWYIDELQSECSDGQNEMHNSIKVESKVTQSMEQTMISIPEDQTVSMATGSDNNRISKLKCVPALQTVSPKYFKISQNFKNRNFDLRSIFNGLELFRLYTAQEINLI